MLSEDYKVYPGHQQKIKSCCKLSVSRSTVFTNNSKVAGTELEQLGLANVGIIVLLTVYKRHSSGLVLFPLFEMAQNITFDMA